MKVKIKKLHPKAQLPKYATSGAAAFDFCAVEDGAIPPGVTTLVPTGLAVEIPEEYEIQVRPRSGLALKKAIMVLNSPGTIDSDYRGEIMIMLSNTNDEIFYITTGDRIAQGVLAPVAVADWQEVEELSVTDRGEGGFGSTGVTENQ